MTNPVLLLSGIGMILVGILFPLYWKNKTKVNANFFFWGAGAWILAITAKILLDMTLTPILNVWLFPHGITTALIVSCLYVGLRTGIFESGFSYLVILKTKLKKMGYKEGVAFGLGFGAVEAIFLGITSFLNILLFVLFPGMIALLPEAQQMALLAGLESNSLIVFAPVMERTVLMFIHVFSTLLVLYAVKAKKLSYLGLSILFKAIVDGIIPWLVFNLSPITDIVNAYLIEIPFIILAVFSYFGIKWIKPKLK